MEDKLINLLPDAGTWISDREIAFHLAPEFLTPSLRRRLVSTEPPDGFHPCLGARSIHFVLREPAQERTHEPANSRLAAWLKDLVRGKEKLGEGFGQTPQVVVRATYGASVSAEIARDLQRLAEINRITPDEVLQRHIDTVYVVSFCGFQPGFAYLEPMPGSPLLLAPRHDSPRASVPAGSVALGGDYCGIYPANGPGGWNLIGLANAWGRDIPNWTPGMTVKFERAPS